MSTRNQLGGSYFYVLQIGFIEYSIRIVNKLFGINFNPIQVHFITIVNMAVNWLLIRIIHHTVMLESSPKHVTLKSLILKVSLITELCTEHFNPVLVPSCSSLLALFPASSICNGIRHTTETLQLSTASFIGLRCHGTENLKCYKSFFCKSFFLSERNAN